MSVPAVGDLRFLAVGQDDPLAAPLIDELAVEYATSVRRYPGPGPCVVAWLPRCGVPVTGGAFRRFDDVTAELKRIWTDSRHRRRGHARALVNQLESEIAARGYSRIYLTTGDRQPEAEALYLSMGYTRLAEPLPAEGEVYPIAFAKVLA